MLTLRSPAKLNLFLKVVGKRPDGYHEIASLFQTVDLFDTIDFSSATKDSINCSDISIPTDRENLILKASHLFREKTGKDLFVDVSLSKNIPTRSGLGGGSSNAATTLWAMNELAGKPATLEELKQWSEEIGSDVPFFFSTGTAYCTGRGENIRKLDPLNLQKFVIIQPDQGLPTPAIYKRLRLDDLDKRDPEVFLNKALSGQPEFFNDLEESAFAIYPNLALLKMKMKDLGFQNVTMTGSGSAMFCNGDVGSLSIPNVRSFEVNSTNRAEGEWYS